MFLVVGGIRAKHIGRALVFALRHWSDHEPHLHKESVHTRLQGNK